MRTLFAVGIALSLAALACGSQQNDGPSSSGPAASGSARAAAPALAASSTDRLTPRPAASVAPAASSSAPAPAPCASDADCDWDDPCKPTVCLSKARVGHDCDKSFPPPGDCLCVSGTCALKPKAAPPPVGPCEWRGCVVDPGHGTCVADTQGLPENQRFTLPVDAGPSCDCDEKKKECVFRWFDPVPCKSDDDCWIDESPRVHPVPKPKGKGTFKPCKDGETSPACGPQGVCVHGKKWKC